LVTIYIR